MTWLAITVLAFGWVYQTEVAGFAIGDLMSASLSWVEALTFSLETAAFQRPMRVVPSNAASQLTRLFQIAVTLPLLGFFGLAVRRRYRR